jgi:hypothetical protein
VQLDRRRRRGDDGRQDDPDEAVALAIRTGDHVGDRIRAGAL